MRNKVSCLACILLCATSLSVPAYAAEEMQAESVVEEIAEIQAALPGTSALLESETEKPDTNRQFPFYSNPKKPAPLGIWLKAYRLSYEDADDHVVYFRVNSIEDAKQEDINVFNAKSTGGIIGDLDDPYLKYCEIYYDVYYPEDFVVGKEGYVVDPTLSFSIVNPAGGGFVTERGIYIGLSRVQPLDTGFYEEDGIKVKPGEVFHGRAVFAMLADEPEFCLEYACRQKEPNGQVVYQYSACR